MWGDMGNFCSKFGDQFGQSIFTADNLAFYPTILKQEQIAIGCVLPTVGVGRCGKMFEKVERYGNRLPSKPYEEV